MDGTVGRGIVVYQINDSPMTDEQLEELQINPAHGPCSSVGDLPAHYSHAGNLALSLLSCMGLFM
jgi:hypothetical protein